MELDGPANGGGGPTMILQPVYISFFLIFSFLLEFFGLISVDTLSLSYLLFLFDPHFVLLVMIAL